jgi:hypothetical protein
MNPLEIVYKNIVHTHEFIDSSYFDLVFIVLLISTILFIYINQFFIEIKDIIILILILFLIWRFT